MHRQLLLLIALLAGPTACASCDGDPTPTDAEPDAAIRDARTPDAREPDAREPDAEAPDAEAPDAEPAEDTGPTEDTGLPPDPATIAPATNPTIAQNAVLNAKFLIGTIQTGADEGAFDDPRLAVIRGSVFDRDRRPLSGVTITIFEHPEFGSTLSRADGRFDLLVNGGEALFVRYEREGFLPAQRKVDVPWGAFVEVEPVCLTAVDPNVTIAEFPSAVVQLARGSTTTDADGTRRSTLVIPAGVTAELEAPDGTTTAVAQLTIRSTEYTVGDHGELMPANLPATSAYTYAVELSADEAIAAGAKVRFSSPVYHYVENFLEFPAGEVVPNGSFDPDSGCWLPEDDGRVIEVLGVDGVGRVELDLDGDQLADDAAALAALGFTDEERLALAALYRSGASLWRVPITHFTPFDHNWPYAPPPGAQGPSAPEATSDSESRDPCEEEGSIIEAENQVLGERIPVAGTPYSLEYRSNRVPGWQTEVVVPITESFFPADLKRIELIINIAGHAFGQTYAPQANLEHRLLWDRLDAYGRNIQGAQVAQVTTRFIYDGFYAGFGGFGRAFGQFGQALSANPSRREVTLTRRQRLEVAGGTWDARGLSLGGWSLDLHHVYDPTAQVLYQGDGRMRAARFLGPTVRTAIGFGGSDPVGDGGPAIAAGVQQISDIAVGPDNRLYVVDELANRLRIVDKSGLINTAAGGNLCGPDDINCLDGDGLPALQASLHNPGGLARGPDGAIYIADTNNNRIRRIGKDGVIETIAGNGDPFAAGALSEGDGGPALEAKLAGPWGIAVGDCCVYFSEPATGRIRRIGPDGVITTIAGDGADNEDEVPAVYSALEEPRGIALGADGSLYIAEAGGNRIRKITPDGIIHTVAGYSKVKLWGAPQIDGVPAVLAYLDRPLDVDVAPDGSFVFADYQNYRVRRVGPDGIINTIAGRGPPDPYGFVSFAEGAPSLTTDVHPTSVAIGPDGAVYFYDEDRAKVRRVVGAFRGLANEELLVPAGGGVDEVYRFDPQGRHLATHHSITGEVLHTFGYDASGLLISVRDAFNNTMTIERAADGAPLAIVGPYGHRTELAVNAEGYLERVTQPDLGAYVLGYAGANGLLTSFTDPSGIMTALTYSPSGRLLRDETNGRFISLARTELGDGNFEVQLESAAGLTRTYRVETSEAGVLTMSAIDPDGSTTEKVFARSDAVRINHASNYQIEARTLPDPRFGMTAGYEAENVLDLPGAPSQSTIRRERSAQVGTSLLDVISLDENDDDTISSYDGATRTRTVTSPEGRVDVYTYDAWYRPLSMSLRGLEPMIFTYDARGRPASATQGMRSYSFNFGADGLLSSFTNAEGELLSYTRDAVGRVVAIGGRDGRTISQTFDAAGKLTSIGTMAGPIWTLGWDGRYLSRISAPAIGAEPRDKEISRDLAGRITRIRLPGNEDVDFTYDAAGRLETETSARGTKSFSYAGGKVAGIDGPSGIGITLDWNGPLPERTTWTGPVAGSVAVIYDRKLRWQQEITAGSSASYTYDLDGLMLSAGWLSFVRSAASGAIEEASLLALHETYAHDQYLELSSVTVDAPSALYSASYTRDLKGRIESITETIQGVTTTRGFSYDVHGRLDAMTIGGMPAYDVTWDNRGNRVAYSTPSGNLTATFDVQDRLQTQGARTYTYRPSGFLSGASEGANTWSYDYDADGTLDSVTLPGGEVISYLSDGLNRRIAKLRDGVLERGYLYLDERRVVAELDAAGALLNRFVWGDKNNVPEYLVRGGATYRIISDHAGSVRLVVDAATGAVMQRMSYGPFGEVLEDTNPGFQPFGFAGGLYDVDTGLVRFGVRDYDAGAGRFTARDPIDFHGGDLNLYRYTGGDPINRIDPSGKIWPIVIIGLGLTAYAKWKENREEARLLEAEKKHGDEIQKRLIRGEVIQGLTPQQQQEFLDNRDATHRCVANAAEIAKDFPGTTITGPAPTGDGGDVVNAVVNEIID